MRRRGNTQTTTREREFSLSFLKLISSSRKRRQVTAKRKVELFESFKGQKLSQDSVADRIFEGVTFCELKECGR